MKRFPVVAAAWTALLIAGFAVVILLGTPVATSSDELASAMRPAVPVTQATAESSAATIVRLQYPTFANTARKITLATDFGIDHWLVEYTDTTGPAPRGIRISIVVASGHVEVATFP